MSNDGESLIVCGNSFHNLGAATEKALSPYVFVVLHGVILSSDLLSDRKHLVGTYFSNMPVASVY
jgi:hypothetical protein